MQNIDIRWFLGWIAMIVGAALGWGFAEFAWRVAHPQGVNIFGLPPTRGVDYWLLAPTCALAGATLGLAFARWRDLPNGEIETR